MAAAVAAVALVVFGGMIGSTPASAAPGSSKPTVEFAEPVVATGSATVGYTINRAPKSIVSMSCALTAPDGSIGPVGCGSQVGATAKSTDYQATLVDLGRGEWAFSVELRLSDRGSASGSVVIVLVNEPPVAIGEEYATDEDAALTVAPPGVLANDADADGDVLTAALVVAPTHGTLALNADGSFQYLPDENFSGVDSFGYLVDDANGALTPATATISVSSVNDAPEPTLDEYSVDEDAPLVVAEPGFLGNDVDVDGDALSATDVESTATGKPGDEVLAFTAGGGLTYTPPQDFNGTRTLPYVVSDGAADAKGSIVITVVPVNDAPVAGDDAVQAVAGDPVVIPVADLLANDSDVDSADLAITAVSDAKYGSAVLNGDAIEFTPDEDAESAGFLYTLSDGALTAVGQVTITFTPPPPTVEEACTEAGGAYLVTFTSLGCRWTGYSGNEFTLRSALAPACPAETAVWDVVTIPNPFKGTDELHVTVLCARPATVAMGVVCDGLAGVAFAFSASEATCGDFSSEPSPTVKSRLDEHCVALGGVSEVVDLPNGPLAPPFPGPYRYVCSPAT
ncbi:cadherin-like domain-containing protein [Agromyces sp. SYSU T00266]|uniref:cadherin-like domain-containing protein n=1 Tax=Agromyces zhanjiangensis TaxID=3158562 RepID=UPI00339AE441